MDFYKKLKALPHHKLKELMLLCGGMALLVAMALALSGGVSLLPPSIRLALQNVLHGTSNTASTYWTTQRAGYGGTTYSNLPSPNSKSRIASTGVPAQDAVCSGVPYCNNDSCDDPAYPSAGVVAIADITSPASGASRMDVVRTGGTPDAVTGTSAGAMGLAAGQTVQLDWSCQDYQDVTLYHFQSGSCAASGTTRYYFAGNGGTVTVSGPGGVIYSGSNLVSSITTTVPNASGNYTVSCNNAANSQHWVSTFPVSVAALSLVANPQTVLSGQSSQLSWSYSGVDPSSCKLLNPSNGTIWGGASGTQTFTSSGTYTVPSSGTATYITATVKGGGGGGSSGATLYSYACGKGLTCYAFSSGSAGSNGGNSTFNSNVIGAGGGGGSADSGSGSIAGSPGTASGGDTNTTGGGAAGGAGGGAASYTVPSGKGSTTYYDPGGANGGAGGQAIKTFLQTALAATVPVVVGAGGAGSNGASSNGTKGSVVVSYSYVPPQPYTTGPITSPSTYTLQCAVNGQTVSSPTTISLVQCSNGLGNAGACTSCNGGFSPVNGNCVPSCPANCAGAGSPSCSPSPGFQYNTGSNTCALTCPANCPGSAGAPNCSNTSTYTYNSSNNTCTLNIVCPANCPGSYPSCTNGYGYTYNSSGNTCSLNPPVINSFSISPTRVKKNTTANITFNYNVTYPPSSCTISAPGFSTISINPVSGVLGQRVASINISQPTTYTLTCGSLSVQSTVQLVPSVIEI